MKRYMALLIVPGVLLALIAVGCGGSGSNGTSSDSEAKDLFVESCGSCHTLNAAGTKGTNGPNLDDAKSSETRALNTIEDGGSGMPTGLLKGEDAKAVARYVAEVAGR